MKKYAFMCHCKDGEMRGMLDCIDTYDNALQKLP